jgi:glycosyltransferase involved in cell wall biosynthesis
MRQVLYLVREYPQVSQTYIRTEIDRVKRHGFAVSVAALFPADMAYGDHEPYEVLTEHSERALVDLARRHRPDIVHCHDFQLARVVIALAKAAGTFFTVRAHSFDVLTPGAVEDARAIRALNDPACRGLLCFPFVVDRLTRAGVSAAKLVPCWPVVDIAKFRNRAPNGPDVMNVGAALPKKAMHVFADLATTLPALKFNLYMIGYEAASIEAYARAAGSPMRVVPPVHPDHMSAEYKKHRWLVYTAAKEMGTVGWPISVAEAQASGVGVLLQNVRPDVADYVGPGGYVFDTIEDARRIISQPFPDERREAGFLHAERSDIDKHIELLFQLWA